jgi:hypothetical protein
MAAGWLPSDRHTQTSRHSFWVLARLVVVFTLMHVVAAARMTAAGRQQPTNF